MYWTIVRLNDGFQASLISSKKELVRCVSWSATTNESYIWDSSPSTPSLEHNQNSGGSTSLSSRSTSGSSTGSGEDETMDTMTPKDIEDYFNEFQSVLANTANQEEEESSDDPGESEADWLKEAGFQDLVNWAKEVDLDELSTDQTAELDGPQAQGNCDTFLSTYTASQQQTIRKRFKVYETTVRKTKAKSKVPDVRDVFASNEENLDVDPKSCSPATEDVPPPVAHQMPLRAQTSVGDDRLILRATPEGRSILSEPVERQKKSGSWADRAFLRSGNKHGYRVASEYRASGDSAGVEVLKFSYKSTLKRESVSSKDQSEHQYTLKPPVLCRLLSQDEDEEEVLQDLGFEVLDSSSSSADMLPDARVLSGPLGVTYASDLGKDDNKKLRSLALIELTALFDSNGISYSRRKAAKKKLNDGVFGSTLTTLLRDDRRKYPKCVVPVILDKMLRQLEHRGLQEEGVLRIAGSRQKVEALKSLLDNNWKTSPQTVDSALNGASVHDIVSLLKNFIRELSEPLLTYKYMEAFLKAMDLRSIVDQLKVLNLAILVLPEAHRETLKRLTSFMVSVASASSRNKMSTHNVAVIMAPNLFPPKGSLKKDTVLTHEVAGAAKSASVTRMFIHFHHCLWIVPPALLRQVRNQTAELLHKFHKGAKPHRRLSKKLSASYERTVVVEIVCGNTTQTVNLNVNGSSSARDVLDAASGSLPKDRYAVSLEWLDLLDSLHLDRELYETGGNIGEHRLDPITRISAILRENPEARFQIRPVYN